MTKQELYDIAAIINRTRSEAVSCPEDHVPINLALDFVAEDLVEYVEKHGPPEGFAHNSFLLECGFRSW